MVNSIITNYLEMKILGKVFNCPYWSNKIKGGVVILRGFLNGKGDSESIRAELEKLLFRHPLREKILSDPEKFRKFAKSHRLGIDCSGLVYRVLEKLVDMPRIFPGGINRTNAAALTSPKCCQKIEGRSTVRTGDLIRIQGGKHIALVIDNSKDKITYIHSSQRLTKIQGVHVGIINLVKRQDTLKAQFNEKTRSGENFGEKYFRQDYGDGFFRLK